jgi:hypothetical protein
MEKTKIKFKIKLTFSVAGFFFARKMQTGVKRTYPTMMTGANHLGSML